MISGAQDIEKTLLKGEMLTWTDPDTGKSDKIKLENKEQRSLLQFLLSSSERDAGNISDNFVEGIKAAYISEDDPASLSHGSIVNVDQSSWRLHKIDTFGFGGINLYEDQEFSYELAGESTCLEGENGSGKSSLISAIQWALTGKIIKDKSEEKDLETPEAVFNEHNENIGSWPPIASYPNNIEKLKDQPKVWVRLTFINPETEEKIVAERRLENGAITSHIDPRIEKFSALFEPAILMPSRLPHIDLSGKTTNLVEAIQKLTGLEPLAELGDFVSGSGLAHSTRQFLKYAKMMGLDGKKAQFEATLQTAHDVFEIDQNNILQYKSRITSKELDDDLGGLETILSSSVTEKLDVLKSELPDHFKPEDNPAKVRNAVNNLSHTLSNQRKDITPKAVKLSELQNKLDSSLQVQLDKKIEEITKQVAEAIQWHKKREADHKLQLKLIASQYHLNAHGNSAVAECPLCDEPLSNKAALSAELQSLKEAKEEAQKSFADRIRELKESLLSLCPKLDGGQLEDYASINPQDDFISDISNGVLEHESVKGFLIGVESFLKLALDNAPENLPAFNDLETSSNPEWVSYEQLSELSKDIANVKRLCALSEWWKINKGAYTKFWSETIGTTDKGTGKYPEDTVQGKLYALTDALEKSKPFEIALTNIKAARQHGKDWQDIRTEQDLREAITESLKPLAKLRKFVEVQSKEALNSLSQDMTKIYDTVCASERFKYEGTKINKKNMVVLGQLNENYKLDATLVANTSWLRAVLWSFVFALRNATLDKIGHNPFPLMVLDDPQSTFDSRHKGKWAELICDLSKKGHDELYTAQFFLTSHDMQFVNGMMRLEKFNGAFGLISYANPTTSVLTIADGTAIERNWLQAESTKSQKDSLDYIIYMRTYVETLLKIMLHGETKNVSGMRLALLRDLLIDRKSKKIPPFDRPYFEELINLTEPGIKQIKIIQDAHHNDDGTIGYNEAKDIKVWWEGKEGGKKGFKTIIQNTFEAYREYRLINGEPRSLFASSPLIDLPEGYKSTLANENIEIKGKVAALTDGRPCDGSFLVQETDDSQEIKLYNHSAYRVTSNTLEPVASYGDIVIVSNHEKVNPEHHNLVVTAIGDRLFARRYNLVDENPELVALVSQAINPKDLKSSRVVHSSSIQNCTKKIVGVLYNNDPYIAEATEDEIVALKGEDVLKQAISNAHLFEINGRSAEPYALDGQHLLVGNPQSDLNEIIKMDGQSVFAVDGDDNTYFKRLRIFNEGKIIALESLDVSGKEQSLIFSGDENSDLPSIKQVSRVRGVIFNLPQAEKEISKDIAA